MTTPHLADPMTESAVLAAMLMELRATETAAAILSEADFSVGANRRIFSALVMLAETGTAIDPITLANALDARGELKRVGGKEHIGELIDALPTAANVEYHARIVRELSLRRQLIATSEELRLAAADRERPVSEITSAVVEQLLPVGADESEGTGFTKPDWWRVMEAIEARAGGKEPAGLLTGFPEIDDVCNGFRPTELVIPGGVAKSGKTVFAVNIARNAMVEQKARVGFVSAEMSKDELMERLLVAEAPVLQGRMASGKLIDDDWPRLAKASGILASAKLFIDDGAEPTLADIRARSLALVAREGPIDLLVVDFLQLVRHELKGRRGDEELTAIAYGLKALAKRLHCVVLAPAQLNYKDVDRRPGQRPRWSDFAGSSGMMWAANVAMLVHRQAMYDPDARDTMEIQMRGRRIPDSTATLRWEGKYMRVRSPRLHPEELERDQQTEMPV